MSRSESSSNLLIAAAQFADRFVAFSAGCFDVELQILDIKLQLVNRFLGDLEQSAV